MGKQSNQPGFDSSVVGPDRNRIYKSQTGTRQRLKWQMWKAPVYISLPHYQPFKEKILQKKTNQMLVDQPQSADQGCSPRAPINVRDLGVEQP